MNNPVSYQHQMITAHFNMQPYEVKGVVNGDVQYHKRYLYNKIISVFDFYIPKTWARNWFRFWLFKAGSIAVVYTHRYGWICQPYSIETLDYQMQPKQILVYNSYIPNEIHGIIDINCGIIHLLDDYFGIDDLLTHYAVLLSQVEKDININLMNANVSYMAEVESPKQAKDIKQAYEDATIGKPLTVINKDILKGQSITTLLNKPKDNFICLDLMETRRAIINAFLTDVGIRNVSVMKKERLTADEASDNNDETKAIVSIMLENMRNDMQKINSLSGLNLDVRLRFENVSRETLEDGDDNG